MISRAMEDYMKAIYTLGVDGGEPVGTGLLAERLDVAAPSVSGMVKKLTELHLVEYNPRHGVTLTPAGEKIALEVVRHHRLLESYLAEALGYSWDTVHDEADRLEHLVSDELEDRIDAALGYPTVDPHGDPIPTREGSIVAPAHRQLTTLSVGATALVGRVSDADPAKLRYLGELGLVPGARLTILEILPFNGPVRVAIGASHDAQPHVLSQDLARDIFMTL